ncbi:E3 ubiquitin-protein ligase SINA-like 10 [Sorghum bicolor]|uniref:E3 ubiquitin-protein ligase SINA-like 10 n=1 Tax=Sorghum bicolor TaxID=4558 RepID=UPI000B42371B|nr:E3 ubiquitin-protein ligase SINA-like 10 [Sorghum bicolor]|eukprot:XP_021305424.1 E3 ubiquitin-protein ligase SINA-like 10 [Sorghum bicolor]
MERPQINISVDMQLLHCAIIKCRCPHKPPVVKCEAEHLLCGACLNGGHCCKCDRASAFAQCGLELDVFIGDARVSCPFKFYGCGASIVYHVTATHQDACAYASCQCAVPRPEPQHHHHRLPIVEGNERNLLVLSVRPCGGANGVASCAVSVLCIRMSAVAEAGPRFTYILWAKSPAAPPQQTVSR